MKYLLCTVALVMSAPAIAAEWRDVALQLVRKEAKVVEAMFPHQDGLWVSVAPDGTPRDGLAQYICLLLHEAGMEPGDFVVVHIWDASAMVRGDLVEIGRFDCYLPQN